MFKEWLKISEIEEESKKSPGIRLTIMAEDLVTPTSLTNDGEKIYITDQIGKVYLLGEDRKKEVFLDITDKINKLGPSKEGAKPGLNPEYDERGLSGLVFHPNYRNNGRFFVYYSTEKEDKDNKNINHDSVLSEYGRNKKEKVLLRIPQEEFSHNGGNIKFGPDGYLYISTGDGGCCGDRHGDIGNAQNLGSLKGKILRIDVDGPGDYRTPSDNPFVKTPGARDEIYAYGFRNPWQISFDGNRLFCGMVGEGAEEKGDGWESIFIVKKGGNHGWRIREGTHYFDKDLMKKLKIKPEDLVDPIFEYNHDKLGIGVIGGYVYRGKNVPELRGKYVFGDWNRSKSWKSGGGGLYYLSRSPLGDWSQHDFKYPGNEDHLGKFLLAIGQCHDNELYLLTKKGSKLGLKEKSGVVYRIDKS